MTISGSNGIKWVPNSVLKQYEKVKAPHSIAEAERIMNSLSRILCMYVCSMCIYIRRYMYVVTYTLYIYIFIDDLIFIKLTFHVATYFSYAKLITMYIDMKHFLKS